MDRIRQALRIHTTRSDLLLREIRELRREVRDGFARVEAALGDRP